MTRVRCQLDECVFWHEGSCSSEEIEVDPELGCLTLMEDKNPGEQEEWSDEELFDPDDWGKEDV